MHSFDDEAALPCQEKANYSNQKDAEAAAVVAKYRHGNKLKVYKCRHCGLWHLASDFSNEV